LHRQIDSLFISDPTKFISGVLCSLSAMVQLELPHINVLTKCDLVDEKELTKYLDPSSGYLLENLASSTDPKWRPLSTAICNVVRVSTNRNGPSVPMNSDVLPLLMCLDQ
jgi:GPN-loop GTPase